jgi:hypothetical protein
MTRSLVAALTGPSLAWRRGRWIEVPLAARGRDFAFGALGTRRARALATSEAITVPRKWQVDAVDTWVAPTGGPWIDRAIGVAAPLLRWLPGAGATASAMADTGRARDEPASSRFAVVATAIAGDRTATVTVDGSELYATTAALIARLAHALATGVLDGRGAMTPSELVSGERALSALPDLTITVTP